MKPAQPGAPRSARLPRTAVSNDRQTGSGAVVIGAMEYVQSEQELDRLRAICARELPDRIRRARGFVAADAAEEIAHIQEEHAVMGARIARLEALLRTATVVADTADGEVATLGSTVEVEYARTGRRATYRLSGIASGADGRWVSARSPVGQALMGSRAGDVVSVELPAGRVERLRIAAITAPVDDAS